jgi:hypothetical protein
MNIIVIPINGPRGSIYYEATDMADAENNCDWTKYRIVCWSDEELESYLGNP